MEFSELPTPTNAFSFPYEHECYDTFFYNTNHPPTYRIWTSSHHRFVAGVGGVTLVVQAGGSGQVTYHIIGSHSTERRRALVWLSEARAAFGEGKEERRASTFLLCMQPSHAISTGIAWACRSVFTQSLAMHACMVFGSLSLFRPLFPCLHSIHNCSYRRIFRGCRSGRKTSDC